ncbi:LysR family transcriptional regulator [Poseidonocella sp. HB161398]|uniref:LysR family transcriptional regulator n=1 Tax=Poseidonocella sp. HB161398 TaxID=2320855 RepID=UPI0014871C7A|nr:LysR family transcriptional regulator [Poseidonocella sp. HB161398]
MELRDLMIFDTVAELGGVTRASGQLNMVQSNVTNRIKALEHAIGTQLFVRKRTGMELTDTGAALRPYVSRISALVREAEHVVRDVSREPSGTLRIGSMETTMAIRLPKVLVAYRAQCPKVALEIGTGPTRQMVEQVLDGRLDCALVAGPVSEPALSEETVLREELVMVTARGWDTLEAYLAAHPEPTALMFREGCSYRARFLRALSECAIGQALRMEFGTLDGILGCVESDIGMSMVPRSVAEAAASRLKIDIHRMGAGGIFVDTVLVRRRDAFETRAFRAFRDTLRAAYPAPV